MAQRPAPVSDIASARTTREESTARHWHSVMVLLDERTDLVGVHPMADLIYDAVRWTA
jgi:hypothetical protein